MQNNQNDKKSRWNLKPEIQTQPALCACCSYIYKYLCDVAFCVIIIPRLLALIGKASHTIPTLSLKIVAVVVEPTTSWATLKCAVLAISGLKVVV